MIKPVTAIFSRIGTVLFLLLQLSAPGVSADSIDLEAWESWVLEKHQDSNCPWQMSGQNQRLCTWPGKLTLALTSDGIEFTFKVDVYSDEALVQIPGDNKYWPNSVSVAGNPAPVVEKNNRPHVSLPRGKHDLRGFIGWEQKPTALTIPVSIALISLFEAGKELVIDRRNNRIIFSQKQLDTSARKRDSLSVEVYRLLRDGVPLTLETRIKLVVSGKPREIKLGRAALAGTEITGLDSRLPAKIEDDGDLRIQVVAGEHYIRLYSRFFGDIAVLETQGNGAPWPTTEYISFISNTNIRQAKLSGAISVDTSQFSIPEDWRGLPTYRLDGTTRLQIETTFRGDHSPLANQIRVRRDLWLDFDGNAITALENVSGSMYRDWRLNARPDTHIGRATVEDQPVLITEDKGPKGTGLQGIEIRSPDVNLMAVTRIINPGEFSATGWDARVDHFLATLHLPPGWRVLHASGVDHIQGTWISQWDLWDIFLLLIMVAATKKMFGLKPAILATFALIISYHEYAAPIWHFPLLLLVIALLTVLTGRWKQVASITGTGLSAILILSLITFAVYSFRVAIYPTLEKNQLQRYQKSLATRSAGLQMTQDTTTVENQPAPPRQRLLKRNVLMEEMIVTGSRVKKEMYLVDENDRLQTGPGLPTWLWNRVTLRASSPVLADQKLSIFYCPPWVTGLWRITSVFLMGAFAALLMMRLAQLVSFRKDDQAGDDPGIDPDSRSLESSLDSGAIAGFLILVTLLALLTPPTSLADEFPPKYLLNDLESRLLKPPACLPNCVSINNGLLVADRSTLHLSFDVYADADIALPVPTGEEGWKPDSITIDGAGNAPASRERGQTLVLVNKGHHKIVLSGKIQGDQASISFPLPIHNFSVVSEHWLVEGLVDDRIPSNTLSLTSKARARHADEDTLIADPVSPFVIVHREFYLGKRWTMTTSVQRIAPNQGPMAVSIPLLNFEKVLSNTLNIKGGNAQLQFNPNQQYIHWESTLTPMDLMVLTAAEEPWFMETWQIVPTSLWRISYSGIPAIKEVGDTSSLQPSWKPWPGETLTINISRPQGLRGPTRTVEEAILTYTAGNRIQSSVLDLNIRSSIGDDYTVILPPKAEVLSLSLDGDPLNLPSGNIVTVPLQPGLQNLTIEFQEHRELDLLNKSPDIQLPGNVTNITIRYELPRDRWPLYVTGPAIGPAMLYWGVLCVIVLGAIILNRLAQKLSLDIPVTLVGWLLLGLGLSTINSYGVLVIAIFFFLMALRKQRVEPQVLGRLPFNAIQVIIALWTIITVLALVAAIPMGLLSDPDMKVVGNGSHSHLYNFYQDRIGTQSFPSAHVFSVSILTYRVVMLAWSLWLATRLIQWAQWWWEAYSTRGVWLSKR